MRFLETRTFKIAAGITLALTIVAASIMVPASWAKKKSTSGGTSLENAKAYVLGFEDGREGTIAAVNANMCGQAYQSKGLEPGQECYDLIKKFNHYEAKYDQMMKIIEDSKKDGKRSKRD